MDPDLIKANLGTKRIGRKILVYRSTSSTNDVAAEYAKNAENDGLVIFAEEQTAGRGRAGGKWSSGRADSILCSIVLTENTLPPPLLSLACAVGAAEAVGRAGKDHAKIKWPNDILLNGRKVGGILLESKSLPISPFDYAQGEKLFHAKRKRGTKSEIGNRKSEICIVGVGINCHQRPESFPEELRSIATSIDIESGSVVDRTSLAKRLLTSIEHWLDTAQENRQKVIERWCELSIQLGRRTEVIFNGVKFAGHCIGIDPEKGLILQLDAGGVRMFDAAHTTIVK